jgi:hypothetical protein
VTGGWAQLEYAAQGAEVGGQLDLGGWRSRQVRPTAEIAFLRSKHREFVSADDTTYDGVFYDLSGRLGVTFLARDPGRAFVPYATAAVGVHVLSSSYGSLVIDQRYNTNSFGLMGAVGVRIRAGRARGLLIEVRRVQADNVSRTSVHAGLVAFLGALRGAGG